MSRSPFLRGPGSGSPMCSIIDPVACSTVSDCAVGTYEDFTTPQLNSPFDSLPCRGRSSTTEMEKPPFSLSKSGMPGIGGFVEERAGPWTSLARRIRPSRGRPVRWSPKRMENGHG